jgi:TolB protein
MKLDACFKIKRCLFFLGFIVVFSHLYAATVSLEITPPGSGLVSDQPAAPLNREEILFNSNRTGNDEIYIMNADGTESRQLTHDKRYDSWWARLSPNRKLILFYRTPAGTHDDNYSQNNLWMMNAEGGSPRLVRAAGADGWKIQGHAEWSPDGKSLVMFGGKGWDSAQIFLTNGAGQESRRLTNGSGFYYDPSWSPDGKTIVFTGCPGKRCAQKDIEVYTLPISSSQSPKRLTNDSIPDYDPYYSPDGKRVGWLSMVGTAHPKGEWSIRLAAADGSGVRFVINDGNINGHPSWSKDGEVMHFHRLVYGKGDNFSMRAIRPDGSGLKQITNGAPGNDEYPST